MNENGREVYVTAHALVQYRKRTGDRRPFREIEPEIIQNVEQALAEGRIANHKPKAFRLWRARSKGKIPPGDRFVWDPSEKLGWIIRREGERDVVLTTLTRTMAHGP